MRCHLRQPLASHMLLKTPGDGYLAIRQLRLNARKPGAKLVDVSHGDVQRPRNLYHDAFGRPCGHYGIDVPSLPAFDE